MRSAWCALLLVPLLVCAAPGGQDQQSGAAVDRFVLTRARILPEPGSAGLLAGARIIGWNWGGTSGPALLARIDQAPAGDGWLELKIASGKVYRFLQLEVDDSQGLALAEIEFWGPSGRLTGKAFGAPGRKDAPPGSTFDKALDGDPNTFFELPPGSAHVGIDLGAEVQCPTPVFTPAEGAFAGPQKIEIATWPPGKTIRYTTDGSVPGASEGTVYSGPISLSATTSIAAIAAEAGAADSEIAIATYRIGAAATAEPQVRSYHLGNSLTDTVNGFLQPIAASGGKDLSFMRKSVPGCSIRFHWEHNREGFASPDAWASDYDVACAKKVDHLFLQPFPNPPGLDDDGAYGGKFIELARRHNPGAEAWLYAQWPSRGNWKGDAHCVGAGWMKPPWFPPNRKPADWEEASANKMLYYLDLKKIWDAR